MKGEILVVDDTPHNLAILVGILRANGYQARVANSGRGALGMIRARAPELVLLDINMPDLDGYEVCRELKADPATSAIPVVFISALDDPLDKVKAFGVGGVDYIPKPFQAEEVLARVENHLKIGRLQRQLQAHAAQLQEALRALAEVSVTDPLTGLRNRRFLLEHIEGDVASSLARYDAATTGGALPEAADLLFFMIDLDHFKSVNDLHGHAAGDAVLAQVGRRLRQVFGEGDDVVRWGGEEFLVLARSKARARAADLAESVRVTLAAEEFVLGDGSRLQRTCSVGFACFPFLGDHPGALRWQDVVEVADAALYLAKRAGRNCCVGLSAASGVELEPLLRELRADARRAARAGLLKATASADPGRQIEPALFGP